MPNCKDVAAYILNAKGAMSAMKLQKLVYYSQAWSLVWDEVPLFNDRIEAWANGPVCPLLYEAHKGQFTVNPGDIVANPDALNPDQRDTVDAVLRFYGDKPGQWLSELTHAEDPWRNARRNHAPGERGSTPITHAAMAEYYSSL